jgi:hypothetical protein
MKHLQIEREHHKGGTLSAVSLYDDLGRGSLIATYYGIERPWLDNRASLSCIPTGHYVLIPYASAKYPNVWAFYGGTVGIETGERTRCLIHVANFVHQVNGCLGLGMSVGTKDGLPCVWQSKTALSSLRNVGDDTMTCIVSWA